MCSCKFVREGVEKNLILMSVTKKEALFLHREKDAECYETEKYVFCNFCLKIKIVLFRPGLLFMCLLLNYKK